MLSKVLTPVTSIFKELDRNEWVGLIGTIILWGSLASYTAMFMGFVMGMYLPGTLAGSILSYPIARYVLSKKDSERAAHLTNYAQTAISAAGSAVGMGSMLLAFQWVTGENLTAFQVTAIAFPASLFGIVAANLWANNLINVLKLKFPSGVAAGGIISGLAQGGKSFYTLIGGVGTALVLTISGFPIGAMQMGAGWIIGHVVMAWALGAAIICQLTQPWMISAGLTETIYREFTMFPGVVVLLVAGLVDMAFTFFSKSNADNPEFREVEGFLPRWLTIILLVLAAILMSLSLWYVFELNLLTTMAMSLLLAILIYIGGVCLGKTDMGAVSALSGVIILLMSFLGKGTALIYGAAAGQALSNGFDQQGDYRTGERLGSKFRVQLLFQILGAALGACILVGAIFAFITTTNADQLTYEAVNQEGAAFDAGFAMKYYGFLQLREKIGGPVGISCLIAGIVTLIFQIIVNILHKAKKNVKWLAVAPYSISFAFYVGFSTILHTAIGAGLAAVGLYVWSRWGKEVENPADKKPEPQLKGINWSYMIPMAGGLILGHAMFFLGKSLLKIGGWNFFSVTSPIVLLIMILYGRKGMALFKEKFAPQKAESEET